MKTLYILTALFILSHFSIVYCAENNTTTPSLELSDISKKEIELAKKIEKYTADNLIDEPSFLKFCAAFALITEKSFTSPGEDISRQIGLQSRILLDLTSIWCKNKVLQNKVTFDKVIPQMNLLISELEEHNKNVTEPIYANAPIPSGVSGISGTDYHTATNGDQMNLWKTSVDNNNANIIQTMINNNIKSNLPMLKKRVAWMEHIIARSGK
jgi:hypothetical protein